MNPQTVFVIGAGASKEVNLPTGYELKQSISSLLDITFDYTQQKSGDPQIVSALRAIVKKPDGQRGDIKPYLHEAWHIRDALPLAISIDNFIDSQRGNEKISVCGKLAIVKSILVAERSSNLFFDKFGRNPGLNYTVLGKTWYLPFFQLLTENCEVNDLEERFKSISLIIFNYDRCIEHFLYNALQNYYRISENEAAELIKLIRIYHPYGSVGSLPWNISNGAVDFGAEFNVDQLLKLTQQIKTFTEGTDPESSDIMDIKEHTHTAKKIVFLGFAFHKLNMELIAPNKSGKKKTITPRCFATTFGISESDKEVIEEQINQLYGAPTDVRMANLECGKFFTEFRRSLAF